ncbi:ricin B lectin domain-containing protein [Aspergillus pseudonomiae]|nr:ricin B lectin domain-containing protein [Aspergillus pseudonomiae]
MSDYTGPGVYQLVNRASDTSLDLYAAGKADGTRIVGWKHIGGNSQKWQIVHAGKDEYILVNAHSGTTATATASKQKLSGTLASPVNKFVRWKIEAAKNGAYRFRSVALPDHLLDLGNGNKADDTPVWLWPESAGAARQEWYIKLV